MEIEIVADLACPWCFVGLAKLRHAMQHRPDVQPVIIWRPFLLCPDLPEGTIDRTFYPARTFGGESRIQQFHTTIQNIAKTVNIELSTELDFVPGTLAAHIMITWAGDNLSRLELAHQIYHAYFVEGKNIADHSVLSDIALKNGLDTDALTAILRDEYYQKRIIEESQHTQVTGISSIPSFIFNEKHILSGVQEIEALMHLIDVGIAGRMNAKTTVSIQVRSNTHGMGTPISD